MNKHHNYFFFQLAFLLGCCFNVPKNSDHVLKPHEAHSLKSIHFSEGNRPAPQKKRCTVSLKSVLPTVFLYFLQLTTLTLSATGNTWFQ